MEIRLRLCDFEPAIYFDGFDTGTTPTFTSNPDSCMLFENTAAANDMISYIRNHTEFEVELCNDFTPYSGL